MSKIKTCRICLTTGMVMSNLEEPIKSFIENIFKQNGFHKHLQSTSYVCFECKALLQKTQKFIKKTLHAQTVLYKLLAEGEVLSLSKLRSISNDDDLKSSLNVHKVQIDFFINADEDGIKNDTDTKYDNENLIKTENEDNLNYPLPENDEYKNHANENQLPIQNQLLDAVQKNDDIHQTTDIRFDLNEQSDIEQRKDLNDSSSPHQLDEDKYYIDDVLVVKEEDAPNSIDDPLSECATKTSKKRQRKCWEVIVLRNSSSESDENYVKPTEVSTKHIMSGKRQRKTKSLAEDDVSSDSSTCTTSLNVKKLQKHHKEIDEDFKAVQMSSESESPYDSYDDSGKRIPKPKDDRVYPMKCDHCSYEIEKRCNHFKHYLIDHPEKEYPYHQAKKYVCQYCGLARRTNATLRNHEMTHGEKNFQCPKCQSKFHNPVHLRRHMRIHDEKEYYCDYCNKGFTQRTDLILHIRIHTGEKPFKCHICGEGFAHKGNVGIHIKARHQRVPREKKSKKKVTSSKKRTKKNKRKFQSK